MKNSVLRHIAEVSRPLRKQEIENVNKKEMIKDFN